MAKQAIPGIKSGGSLRSKAIQALVAITFVTLVVKYPSETAEWTRAAFAGAGSAIEAFATFVRLVAA